MTRRAGRRAAEPRYIAPGAVVGRRRLAATAITGCVLLSRRGGGGGGTVE